MMFVYGYDKFFFWKVKRSECNLVRQLFRCSTPNLGYMVANVWPNDTRNMNENAKSCQAIVGIFEYIIPLSERNKKIKEYTYIILV